MIDNSLEYIICAALHYQNDVKYQHQPKNIESGMVFCGRRHHNCFQPLAIAFPDRIKSKIVQGFITSKDRFVERKEAGEIAYIAKQITEPTDCLFSEDLY